MSILFSWPLTVAMSGCLMAVCTAAAQPVPSLRGALDAAWALSPQARSLVNHRAELEARATAAVALIPGPPTVSLSQRQGAGATSGTSESEIEVAVPLWRPGARSTGANQIAAEREAFEHQLAAAKLQLAAEVRELAAQAAFVHLERELAQRKIQDAAALTADVERRVKAGETARIDLLQTQSAQRQAIATQAQAANALDRALAQWRWLTGLSQVAALDESPGETADHPTVTAAKAKANAARARLVSTEADLRDPMELGLGFVRDRPGPGVQPESSVKIVLRVPLGSYGRNAPKLAAARAELDVAEAELEASKRQVQAERTSAIADLEAARRVESLAVERERYAQEVQALIAKSHRLGESDLPTRLRADAERFDAELSRARATIETRRAISKINQANGALP